jgi:hypothetical protein
MTRLRGRVALSYAASSDRVGVSASRDAAGLAFACDDESFEVGGRGANAAHGRVGSNVPLVRAPITLALHAANFDYPGTPPGALFGRLVEIVRTAEAAGFSSITVGDHLHSRRSWATDRLDAGGQHGSGRAGRADLAGQLRAARGGVTFRNPALLAKITTILDVISGGRAILGLGAAYFEDEHRACGFEFPPLKERLERLEEAVQIARAMFAQEESSFQGRHYARTTC